MLGGLLLSDILDTATDLVNEAPGITTRVIYPKGDNSQLPRANETRFYWTVTKPTLKPDPLGIFQPKDGCSLTLRAVFLTPLDPPGEPTYEVVGDLRKFDVQLLGSGAAKFIILQFNKLIFRSETGAKPRWTRTSARWSSPARWSSSTAARVPQVQQPRAVR